jgi:hypothetical protein
VEIRIGVSCFSGIGESKTNGIYSSRHVDGGKNPHCPLAQWAVQCFREWPVGGLNNYGPCVITNSHRTVKVNAPDVSVGDEIRIFPPRQFEMADRMWNKTFLTSLVVPSNAVPTNALPTD